MPTTLSKTSIVSIVAKIKVDPLSKRVTPAVKSIVTTFGDRAVEQIDSEAAFKMNRRVTSFLQQNQQRLVGVNRTTQKQVTRVLSDGVSSGKTIAEIANDISGLFDQNRVGRAVTIARTAVMQASNFATKEGYRQVGVEEKEWLTTSGGDARPSHDDMDGQVRGINDDFTTPDGATAEYPGDFGDPSEDVNCRCSVLPVVNEKRWRMIDRKRYWKSFEQLRSPYDRAIRMAVAKGFSAQKAIVMAAIRSYDDVAAAA